MFTSDDFDFLKGGLLKVTLAGGAAGGTPVTLASNAVQIFGVSASQGALPVVQAMPALSPFAASLAQAYGASNCGVLRSSVGTVYSLYALNVSGAAHQYIQLHNSAAAVASGAVPLRSFHVGAAGTDLKIGHEVFTQLGDNFSLGVTYAWSTVPHLFTQADGNNYQLEVRLK